MQRPPSPSYQNAKLQHITLNLPNGYIVPQIDNLHPSSESPLEIPPSPRKISWVSWDPLHTQRTTVYSHLTESHKAFHLKKKSLKKNTRSLKPKSSTQISDTESSSTQIAPSLSKNDSLSNASWDSLPIPDTIFIPWRALVNREREEYILNKQLRKSTFNNLQLPSHYNENESQEDGEGDDDPDENESFLTDDEEEEGSEDDDNQGKNHLIDPSKCTTTKQLIEYTRNLQKNSTWDHSANMDDEMYDTTDGFVINDLEVHHNHEEEEEELNSNGPKKPKAHPKKLAPLRTVFDGFFVNYDTLDMIETSSSSDSDEETMHTKSSSLMKALASRFSKNPNALVFDLYDDFALITDASASKFGRKTHSPFKLTAIGKLFTDPVCEKIRDTSDSSIVLSEPLLKAIKGFQNVSRSIYKDIPKHRMLPFSELPFAFDPHLLKIGKLLYSSNDFVDTNSDAKSGGAINKKQKSSWKEPKHKYHIQPRWELEVSLETELFVAKKLSQVCPFTPSTIRKRLRLVLIGNRISILFNRSQEFLREFRHQVKSKFSDITHQQKEFLSNLLNKIEQTTDEKEKEAVVNEFRKQRKLILNFQWNNSLAESLYKTIESKRHYFTMLLLFQRIWYNSFQMKTLLEKYQKIGPISLSMKIHKSRFKAHQTWAGHSQSMNKKLQNLFPPGFIAKSGGISSRYSKLRKSYTSPSQELLLAEDIDRKIFSFDSCSSSDGECFDFQVEEEREKSPEKPPPDVKKQNIFEKEYNSDSDPSFHGSDLSESESEYSDDVDSDSDDVDSDSDENNTKMSEKSELPPVHSMKRSLDNFDEPSTKRNRLSSRRN